MSWTKTTIWQLFLFDDKNSSSPNHALLHSSGRGGWPMGSCTVFCKCILRLYFATVFYNCIYNCISQLYFLLGYIPAGELGGQLDPEEPLEFFHFLRKIRKCREISLRQSQSKYQRNSITVGLINTHSLRLTSNTEHRLCSYCTTHYFNKNHVSYEGQSKGWHMQTM